MPKISIVIPIYNVEKYLRCCLDSVLNQTFQDFEVICINDGSPDNSANIVEEYVKKDNRIKMITQENKGVSVARNVGIQMAEADYIAFVDSDDELAPTFLDRMYDTITQTNSDVVWCDFVQGKTPPEWEMRTVQPIVYDNTFDKFVSECPNMQMVIWNKLWRKDIVQKCPFISELKYGEDIVFLHQALYNARQIAHLPEKLYFYLEREGSIVHSSFNQKMIDDAVVVVRSLIPYFEDKTLSDKTYRILHQKLAKRLFKFFVLEPKRKDKANMEKWHAYTRPLLAQLKHQGVYQPHYLTLKNRIKSWMFLKGK